MAKEKKSQEKNEIKEEVAKAFSEVSNEAVDTQENKTTENNKKEVKEEKVDTKKSENKTKKPTKKSSSKKSATKKPSTKKTKNTKKDSSKKARSEKDKKKALELAVKEKKAAKKKSDRQIRKEMSQKRREIKKRNRRQFKSITKDFIDGVDLRIKRVDAFIKRIFSVFGLVIDKSINSTRSLKIIALCLAVSLYIFVVEVPEQNKITGNPEMIYNVPVEVNNQDELYVVEGLPETADMLLIGTMADLLRAVNLKDYEVYIDLNGLGPGVHEVELGYRNLVTDLRVELKPEKVTLQIFKKVNDSLTLSKDVINLDKKDPKLELTDIKLDVDEVTVRGADYQVEKIVGIKALIDASKIKNTGEVVLEDNQIIAYDSKGMPVEVEIFPKTVSATIQVEAPFNVVPIIITTVGELPDGFAVEDFKIEPANLTIYAPQDVLDEMTTYNIEVDLSDLDVNDNLDDIIKKFTIERPSEVNQILEETVSITTSFSNETEVLLENITINGINVPNGLKVSGATTEDVVVNVLVKGSSSILSQITREDIIVEVDLAEFEAGEHQVDLIISKKDSRLTYELQKEKVTLILEKE